MFMNRFTDFILLCILCTSCQARPSAMLPENGGILHNERDREIAEAVFSRFADERKEATGALVVKIALFFLETPYVANTLEKGDTEKLVINLREMDCSTFAENCLALARTVQMKRPDFRKFTVELENIRYRGGIRNGYVSRLHYFSDWIYDNDQKKVVRSVSQDISHMLVPNQVNFMSTHPGSYPQLKKNPGLIAGIAEQEKEISNRMTWFIPKDKLAEAGENLQDGDIIGITTGIEGLDVSHVVIAWRNNGRLCFIHASSKENKVVTSAETLGEYLLHSKLSTGVMVARPL